MMNYTMLPGPKAKAAYRQKIEGHFSDGDPRHAWQGIQHLINYKRSKDMMTSSSNSLAEELNHFLTCFEVNEVNEAETWTALLPTTNCLALNVSTADVMRVLHRVNPRKAREFQGGYAETVRIS